MAAKSRIRWIETLGPAANARRHLPALVAAYAAWGRRLMEGRPGPDRWHALRLRTKRVRYTLELFAPCYGPGLDARLALLRGIQQQLGEINDCASTRALVGPVPAPLVARYLNAREAKAAGQVRRLWRAAFEAPGRDLWWEGYLKRARAPSTR